MIDLAQGFYDGQGCENARLLPIIQALADSNEALVGALKFYSEGRHFNEQLKRKGFE